MSKPVSTNRITIINILSIILLQGISFLTAPIFSRLLGTENYGILSTFSAWTGILCGVFGLQTGTSLVVARKDFPESEQLRYQSSAASLSVVSYAVFSGIFLLFLEPASKILGFEQAVCVLMLLQGFAQVMMEFFQSKFTMEFKADRSALVSIGYTTIGVVLSLVMFRFVSAEKNYYARMIGTVGAGLAIGVVLYGVLLKQGKVFFNKKYWLYCLPIALPSVLHVLSGTIMSQSDRLMLKYLLSDGEVGIYSLASAFSGIIATILFALNNSWSPFYHEYSRNNETDKLKQHARNLVELFTVLSIGFLLLSPEVFKVFASEEFWGGGIFIPIMVISTFFTFLYTFPVNYEFFCHNTKYIAIATSVAAGINILLNYFLTVWLGVIGVVLATLIAHVAQFSLHYICANYIIKPRAYPFPLGFFTPYTVLLIAVAVACFAVNDRFALIRWAVGAVLGALELYRIYKRKRIF